MSTFVPPTSPSRRHTVRQAVNQVPLRIKLITAVLTLVAIALAVISVASIVLFRDYQLNRASQQVTSLFYQAVNTLHDPHNSALLPGNPPIVTGAYVAVVRPVGQQLSLSPYIPSLPNVPTTQAWLTTNAEKLVDVPALSGKDNWRVITGPVNFQWQDPFTGDQLQQSGTLIVGVDLGDINGTIGQLAYIDLVVSLIVLVALAMVGIAIVRTSLRPLKEIETTAAAIAAGDLSRRVPEQDPRTEVGRLGRALNMMLAQIESAFHARERSEASARRSEERIRQFVADASHELRTPLTAIRGYAEYYRQRGGLDNGSQPIGEQEHESSRHPAHDGAPDTAPASTAIPATPADSPDNGDPGAAEGPAGAGPLTGPDMNRIMERVEQESFRMGGLVEDMLMLARLDEQRPIERRPVDLLTLAADAVQDARIVAPGRAIDLTVGTGAAFLVLGDEARLRQVISNLMSNALTHTPEGSPINVRILAGQQAGNPPVPSVVLEVADHGPGLTPEQASRVFERFYRADQARGRRTGGSGLGLAIVDALVAAHDGTVSVDTGPGHGATFRITLPLAPEALATEPVTD